MASFGKFSNTFSHLVKNERKMSKIITPVFNRTKTSSIMDGFSMSNQSNNTSFINGISIKLEDSAGSLSKILNHFSNYNINLSDIQSRTLPLDPKSRIFDIFFDDNQSSKTKEMLQEIKKMPVELSDAPVTKVKWFPQNEDDLSLLLKKTLTREEMLGSDHPGVTDPEYIKRRDEIASISKDYKGGELPYITYTETENKLWKTIFGRLTSLYPSFACKNFNKELANLLESGVFTHNSIPQIKDLSNYLTKKTGFKLRPVTGLLDSRDFLNALAFKVFYATQYLRHPSAPFYTPEPDLIHELLGHASLLADKDFSEFTQLIGIASLGATDEQIQQLSHLYWYTNEFGLLKEGDERKAFGAGLLSSVDELQVSTSRNNMETPYMKLDPFSASVEPITIHNKQLIYFVADSLEDVKNQCLKFTQTFTKPFSMKYFPETNSVGFTTPVKLMK